MGAADGGWREQVTDMSTNPAVTWGTTEFLQPVSGHLSEDGIHGFGQGLFSTHLFPYFESQS